jgi:hypothetical protein
MLHWKSLKFLSISYLIRKCNNIKIKLFFIAKRNTCLRRKVLKLLNCAKKEYKSINIFYKKECYEIKRLKKIGIRMILICLYGL